MRASVGNHIVLIGAGDVGRTYAYALVNQGLADHLPIIDIDQTHSSGTSCTSGHGVNMALFEKIVGDAMATGFDGIPLVAGDPDERERFTQIVDQPRDAAYRINIGAPAVIGRAGVQRVVEPELDTTGR